MPVSSEDTAPAPFDDPDTFTEEHHPRSGYTGTSCPECGMAQLWCPSGVTCANGHGFGMPHVRVCDAPQPVVVSKPEQIAAVAKTELATSSQAWRGEETGVLCPVCDGKLKTTPAGVACIRGHGWPSLERVESLRRRMAGLPDEEVVVAAPQERAAVRTPVPPPVVEGLLRELAPQAPHPAPVPTPQVPAPRPALETTGGPEPAGNPSAASEPVPGAVPADPGKRGRRPRTAAEPAPAPMGDRSPMAEGAPAEPPAGLESPQLPAYRDTQREAFARRLDELVLGPGFDRIVETVFSVDPWASYEQLEAQLSLPKPAHQNSRAAVVDALDVAEDNAREAHRLACTAKEVVRRFEADAVVLAVDMRQQATASLQTEKDNGQRSKQITDADVESRMAALFPDEWRQIEMRRSRAKLMVEHMSRLADLWRERSRALRAILEGLHG